MSRQDLLGLFRTAVAAVRGGPAVERALHQVAIDGPVHVLAVGKAATSMAEGAIAVLGSRIATGVIATKAGHGRKVPGFSVRECGHPVPDERSVAAAEETLGLAAACGSGETLLVLVSGGASALWCAPPPSLGLDDKRALTKQLLGAGVDIIGFNVVRKHLSRIKGGGLARAAHPARVVTLLLSDVQGDVPDVIGSGPTAPDPSTYSDAIRVLAGAGLGERAPERTRALLEAGARGEHPETPKPGDPVFDRVSDRIVARLHDAILSVVRAGAGMGLRVRDLGACLYGEAREEGARLARLARSLEGEFDLIVAGGEPTVRLHGAGRGGRAQEMALAFARAVEGSTIEGLFAGTDGTDGPTDAAGAIVDGGTVERAIAAGADPDTHLERNDAYPLLEATGDLLRTGPTDTNVTDLALIRLRV